MPAPPSAPETSPHGRWSGRDRLSALLALGGAFLVATLGLHIYLADGSYFLGEASVVLSLDQMTALETFRGNLLAGGQNFPRVYLLAIRLVREALGASTWATRLLPQLFFLAATVLWMRLLFIRFRKRPPLVLLGVVLLSAAATWPIYGAAVKQYTFDVFLALLLFSVPDRMFEAVLREGRRRLVLVALLAPVALSYPYGIVFLARALGWLAYDARRRGFRLDPAAAVSAIALFALFSGVLWLTDIRHTLGQSGLFLFWTSCTLPLPPAESLALYDRFVLGWYDGRIEFARLRDLPFAIRAGLHVGFALGLARMAATLVSRGSAAPPGWGSRSVGSAAGIAGAIASSFVLDYPLCSGRLLLYVLWFQHVLLLEGFDWALDGFAWVGRRVPRSGHALAVMGTLAVVAFAAGLGTTAYHIHRDLRARLPIEDVRPHLAKLATAPELPIVVTPCMDYQIQTLPEGLASSRVVVQPFEGDFVPLPLGEEVWIIHSLLFPGFCQAVHHRFVEVTTEETPRGAALAGKGALVYRTHLLTLEGIDRKKEETHRRAVKRKRARQRTPRPAP